MMKLSTPRLPVGHADDEAVDASLVRLVDKTLHGGDQHLAALQTKSLLRNKLLGQKLLESEVKMGDLKNETTSYAIRD